MKIRKFLKKDIKNYIKIVKYCFNMSEEDSTKYLTGAQQYGRGSVAEENDQIVSAMFYYPFKENIRYQKFKMAGLSGVVTMPEFRNKGYVRKQIEYLQKDMQKQGYSVSVLEPFKHIYYEKFGWCDAGKRLKCKIAIKDIKKFDNGFQFVRLDNPKAEDFIDLERKFVDKYNGCSYREKFFWEKDILYQWHKSTPKSFYLIKKNNKTIAYLIYTMQKIPDSFEVDLRVRDFAYLNYSGIKGIFTFFKSHRDQVRNVIFYPPTDLDIYHFMPTHFKDIKLVSDMMFKVIDINKALIGLKLKCNKDIRFTLKISDPISEENSGIFTYTFKNGKFIRKFKPNDNIIECNINTLSKLFIGRNSINELIEFGDVKISKALIPLFDEIFPKEDIYIKDWF